MRTVKDAVAAYEKISPLLPSAFMKAPPYRFDFSRTNPDIQNVDMMKPEDLQRYVHASLKKSGTNWGFGGYGEDRFFYQSSELFRSGDEFRTIHLGVDIWLPPRTQLFSPLSGSVHSFQNNDHFLDYGPTILLEHTIDSLRFFVLYGHLTRDSLEGLHVGKKIESGEPIARIGEATENGTWAPHLHLQIITDLLGKTGDYPGTATPSQKQYYLNLCPDPQILFDRFLVSA